jgi:hypothetical protein
MPKKSGSGSAKQRSAWELLRGGRGLPKGLVDARIAEIKRRIEASPTGAKGLGTQMSRAWGRAQGPRPLPSDPKAKKALDELLAIHRKLGKRPLAAPKLPIHPGGLLPGQISVQVTPPYDYALTIETPPNNGYDEPATTFAAANKNGQLSCSAVTNIDAHHNMGSAFAEVGIYFHPLSAGTLTVSAAPIYSFEWWTNSLGAAEVQSMGTLELAVYGLQLIPENPFDFYVGPVAGVTVKTWNETTPGQIGLDTGFDVQSPLLSTQIAVERDQLYVVFVDVDVHVVGAGWPGSLAGALVSAAVPSINWTFDPQVVATL